MVSALVVRCTLGMFEFRPLVIALERTQVVCVGMPKHVVGQIGMVRAFIA
jgi:hypothetical protein